MKFKLTGSHKIINEFEINLPDFTILTGINGVGKTKILKAILRGEITTDQDREMGAIKYVNNNMLSELEVEQVHRKLQTLPPAEDLSMRYGRLKDAYIKNHGKPILEGYKGYSDHEHLLYSKIAQAVKKDINKLTLQDLRTYMPISENLNGNSIFYQNFYNLFYRYHCKLFMFGVNNYLADQPENDHLQKIDISTFRELHGEEPWLFANKIIEAAKLNYRFISPLSGNEPSEDFILTLVNTLSGAEVKFEDLSSGEKVILSLVFAMYNSNIGVTFPKILLMDEPDASLHPSMIKHFLDVIKKIFVAEKKVHVIMTTHSPTTIALADEENIYVVRSPGAVIEKTTKDKALKMLTEGVPSFSVKYENRRQIFVEDRNDVRYYEKLYGIFTPWIEPEISLTFIPVGAIQKNKHGTDSTGCSTVINVIEMLRDAGNDLVFGLVDGDNKRQSTNRVKTVGNGNRYAIENYIFDPILLAIFLLIMDEKFDPAQIGLSPEQNYTHIQAFDNTQLQVAADAILALIKSKANAGDDSMVCCPLVGGKEIILPLWFLKHNGHELEKAIKETFPFLQAFSRDESQLKLNILNKVPTIFPELLSADLLETFKKLQN